MKNEEQLKGLMEKYFGIIEERDSVIKEMKNGKITDELKKRFREIITKQIIVNNELTEFKKSMNS